MEMRLSYRITHAWEIIDGLLKGPDRKKAYLYGACAAIAVALLAAGGSLYGSYGSAKKAVDARKRDMVTMAALKAEYSAKKASLDALAARAAPQGSSPAAALEEVARRTGARLASVKPLEEMPSQEYIDKPAEVRLEAIDLNRLVNFIYQAESGPALMVVRELSMKSRFDNPDLLDVTMKISLVTRGM